MFKKNTSSENINTNINTLIGKGSTFEGKLNAQGTVRIDGEFLGDIIINGNLILGVEGKISGNIQGDNVIISGSVHGNINTNEQLKINSSGKVIGDLKVDSLVIEDKAIFEGKCSMKTNSTQVIPIEKTAEKK
ncbi:MAG: polymer-forming cytoskeletal protein [Anaeromicrobium sp.]|jgi:cytoskeletal protein CcmA (bactofilin family)|uniref:bactofilin family protein n=1 Tax=Anaeromicrobium sp. TaxID=1929132 RepID=UPI0025D20C00|nr:polymer-forming cytoskeletal protein [Anaeromicrobium sp.]MCT4596080.1 polymer-forming cytoskeletal protein [Anaeromicrobium sp.]